MKTRAGRIASNSALWLLLALAPLHAAPAEQAKPPERVINLLVYGDDPCPAGENDEIIVCARRPESERYRIPKDLREEKEDLPDLSWGARVESLDAAQRETRPDSCSVVGSGGQTGCLAQWLRQWLTERRAARP